MLVIPAVDIRGGNCVRLVQGRLEEETIFSKDPVFIARLWQAQGAERLHIVDLDGAFSGMVRNFDVIKRIVKGVNIPVQVGGGIRNINTIKKMLNIGVYKVILGTAAIYDPDMLKKAVNRYKNRIMISIDMLGGKVKIAGWKETTSVNVLSLAERMEELKIGQIILTDIKKDGTLAGPNIRNIKMLTQKIKASIIVSGGISSIKDVKKVKALEKMGVIGMIIGKALYLEKVDLREAIKIAKK